ncbi:hypothetical protein HN51_045712 [Arachis hypogaea]|nr:pathogenesis-related protein 1-like [Arachis ipaensis]
MKRITKILVMLIKFLSITPLGLLAQNHPNDYLEIHNKARASVGVDVKMEWDKVLEIEAQDFLFEHKGDCLKAGPGAHFSVGQNNARKLGSLNFSGVDAVRTWVEQKKHYNYKTNSCVGGDCRAYKQVVWKTTTHVGCGRVICHNDAGILITCVYDPPGNIPAIHPY